ncbi:hypothetical protein DV26_09795 [Amycolatopsis mediterranei]|uniref:Uncharacterized protein n=1 Tax=Amycolatopsis mediterranei (strain S699) TaxID=713604 RepID=A0A9R0P2U9_AMYMS|nr:hypothetical protein RAM_33705 [Amycolatopsis mediterranei S699]KDO10817.1 hypothetical protein DV26_09795 [Amycolatopsis mediterranei]
MTHQLPDPGDDNPDENRAPDDSPDGPREPPRRDAPQGPLEDDQARSRKGHPSGNENFRGEP